MMMHRSILHAMPLLLIGLVATAFAQNDPEGTLQVRVVLRGEYSTRVTEQNSDKIGAVTTGSDRLEETWDRLSLIFNGTTKWKYRDGVPVEMNDQAMITCSGGGGLNYLTKHVTAINKDGEWAPYHYTTSKDGSWTYSAPPEPVNPGVPPLMGAAGSVVVVPPVGMYSLVLHPYPNLDSVDVKGEWTERMRPKQSQGSSRVTEDQRHEITSDHNPFGDSRARYIVKDAWARVQELLKPATGIQGTWDVTKSGFVASGHFSEGSGPQTETLRTQPVNDGDRKSTGLTTVANWNWTADVSWLYEYNITPVEAIIKPTGEYKTWAPSASVKAGKPGNTIGFKVELRDKKTGGKPQNTTATFRFKLLETSTEPGSCLNSPWTDTEPDLKILKQDNADLADVAKDGQSATSKDKLTECPVSISCFDGGAHGRLQIEVDLSDGRRTVAFLEEGELRDVAVPYDEDHNFVADAWEDDQGVQGQSGEVDDERHPVGDLTPGDGLTLWEEYRGFLEAGKHIHGNPSKKDYFIADTVGGRIKPGIQLFETISELEVHSDLTVEELGTDRIINRNHGDRPHVVDQHGILIGQRVTDGTCEAISRLEEPSTPKDIIEVVIDPQVDSVKRVDGRSYDLISSFVAHELLHACSVWHHGACDQKVWWREETKPDGTKAVYEYLSDKDFGQLAKGTPILPRFENGTLLATFNWTEAERIHLGLEHGQHSGFDDCVMRYDCATAYLYGLSRYYLQQEEEEVPGFRLCEDRKGTGVNAASRAPRSRYGDAARGNCTAQIRVKDPF